MHFNVFNYRIDSTSATMCAPSALPALSIERVIGALSVMLALASCNSLGLGVPICDADDEAIWRPLPKGCTKKAALAGDSCADGYNMWWATAPKHTNRFKNFASTSPTSETQSRAYTPGALTYIHVRATEQDLKYRGLLLYAQDESGKKVGSWELPHEVIPDRAPFHTHCIA